MDDKHYDYDEEYREEMRSIDEKAREYWSREQAPDESGSWSELSEEEKEKYRRNVS